MTPVRKMVQPIHFDDFSGAQFERLVFAYLLRTGNWISLEWYGQIGSDMGRDIWGRRVRDGFPDGEKVCIQCANRRRVPLAKVCRDMDSAIRASNGPPDTFVLVAGSAVSANLRDRTKAYAAAKGIRTCEVWSGAQFEEMVRARAEALLLRFVRGEEFPDSPEKLREFDVAGTGQWGMGTLLAGVALGAALVSDGQSGAEEAEHDGEAADELDDEEQGVVEEDEVDADDGGDDAADDGTDDGDDGYPADEGEEEDE